VSKFVRIAKENAKTMFEDGITVYFNSKKLRKLDYEPEEVISRKDFDRHNMEWFIKRVD